MGGFLSAIGSLCLIIVTIFQYHGPYQFVMADLFFSRKNQVGSNQARSKMQGNP